MLRLQFCAVTKITDSRRHYHWFDEQPPATASQHLKFGMKSDYPQRPVVSVGAIVIHNDCALIVKRGTNPRKSIRSVPVGKVELSETLSHSVAREAQEETGIVVEPGEVLDVSDVVFHNEQRSVQFDYVFIDFLCQQSKVSWCRNRRHRSTLDQPSRTWVPDNDAYGRAGSPKSMEC